MVLAFVLGVTAAFVRSDLKFPEPIYAILSVYLLLAIGIKGGVTLSQTPLSAIGGPLLATLALSGLLPLIAFGVLRLLDYSKVDSAALAAHYGSVSVITFIASQIFVESTGYSSERYMTALLALLEVPAIIIALLLSRTNYVLPLTKEIKKILSSKSILLLIGGIVMGFLSGERGLEKIAPLFVSPFEGMLVLFLLEMGLVAGHKLLESRHIPVSLVIAGIILPIINGCIGVYLAKICGMSVGSATVFATLAASASYIAAPAAVRMALPQANPGYYLTASLAITFPFNLSLGIPLYHKIALKLI